MQAHSTTEQTRVPTSSSGPSVTKKVAVDGHGHGAISWRDRTWSYPAPPTEGAVTETIHGCEIADPYRSFEVLEAESTQAYINAQNELSKPLLHSHPMRKQLEAAVEQSYAYERTTCPELQGDGYYYWLYNPGTSPRDVLVKSKDLKRDFGKAPGGVGPTLVFDPNAEEDVSLFMHSWSPSGRYCAAILQKAGSDWQDIRAIDTVTCQQIEPDLTGAKFTFGATWVHDTGYLYKAIITQSNGSHFSGADGAFGYFYHRLHTPQSEDVLVWHGVGPNAASLIAGRPYVMSANERNPSVPSWMFWDVYRNTNPETETFVIPMPADSPDMGRELAAAVKDGKKWLTRGWGGDTHYIGTLSSNVHLFKSTDGIEAGQILSLSIDDSTWTDDRALSLETAVPPHPDGLILQSAHLVNDQILVLVYLRDACAEVVFADARTGRPIGKADARGTRGHAHAHLDNGEDVPVPHAELEAQKPGTEPVVIPQHASISAVSCRSDSDDLYLAVDTYVAPPYVLSGKVVNVPGHGTDVVLDRLDHGGAPHEDLICREVLYTSFDGSRVPLFINHAKDLDLSRPHPVLLYAYGGFGVCLTPTYNPLFASFMRDLRGIVAVACIRGGGEYGKAWHDVAAGKNRTMCFDDMAYAARYLHDQRLSTPALTSIYGISNGGTLVGACANRNPELYNTVFCDVGVLDATRFHKFTLGRLWTAEVGDPDDPEHLPFIHSWSPIHNVPTADKGITYPAVLVTTGDHDTRVVPGHSLKHIAQLQSSMPQNRNVFLARIYENAGHESGSKSVAQRVEEAVDRLVFVLSTMSTEV